MDRVIKYTVWNELTTEDRESLIRYWKFVGKRININSLDLTTDTSIVVVEKYVYRHYRFELAEGSDSCIPYTTEELHVLSNLMV